ncbi:MAG: S41 family peptidase [Planctomycetaceae bacterium]|jgi:carboxyl-terminal processing protease|nr:S41 family peptidase [Planctomycetaceae bacterium]
MPLLNIRIILIVVMISLLCAWRTTLREQVLLHFYRKIQRLSLVRPSEEDVFEGALEGMTAKLREDKYGDRYSHFENPQDQTALHDQLINDLVGLGVLLEMNEKTHDVLLFPLPKSPALEAGVKYGDQLLKINGKEIKGLTLRDLSSKLQGEEGSKILLSVRRADSENHQENELEIEVARTRQRLPSVTGDRFSRDGTWNYTLETAPEIGYLGIRTTFSDTTAEEVRQALESLEKTNAKGVILDLRNNLGGYLNAAIDVCNLFLNEGIIVSTTTEIVLGDAPTEKPGFSEIVLSAAKRAIWHKPVVVLINQDSASAAEIVAACLQDHQIATVVGSRSYGKGTVQEMAELPFQLGTVRLTKAQYLRPSRKNINRTPTMTDADTWGVTPNDDCTVDLTPRQENALNRLRKLRMIVPQKDFFKQTEQLLQRIRAEESELSNGEKKFDADAKNPKETERQEPSELIGNAPYYDPQLDKAAECLRNKINE